MKTKTILITSGIFLVILLTVFGIMFWRIQDLKQTNIQLSGELNVSAEKLSKSLQRAETKITSNKDELERFAETNKLDIDKIKDDLASLNANLEAISTTLAKTKTVNNYYSVSDKQSKSKNKVPECPIDGRPIDIHGYTKSTQHRHLDDSNGMRVADVAFDASSKRPWSSTVYGLRYRINSSIGRTSKGTITLHSELLVENPEISPGEYFSIEGVESRVLQVPEAAKFDAWDPGIYLSIGLGVGVWSEIEFSAVLSLGFSIMSYGDWRFIGLTAGLDASNMTFMASFFPFAYNIGEPIPLLSDLWIFPYIGIDHTSEISIGIGLATLL
jgi:hypothetical protein